MDESYKLLRILEELTPEELRRFAFYLPRAIPGGKRDAASRVDLAEVILRYYPEEALDVAVEVLRKLPRNDLVLQLQGQPRGADPRAQRTEEERQLAAAAEQEGGRATVAGLAEAAPPKLVTQEQLMRLAQKMGKNWKEIGILFLGMEMSRLEQFEEENPRSIVMQVFNMLHEWRNREKEKATAGHLHNILNQKGVGLDPSAYAFLIE